MKDFSFQKIESIHGFFLHYQNQSFQDSCVLDVDFVIRDQAREYIARFRFTHPNSIKFESGGIFHQMSIEMYDIGDRGWENKKYEVIDYEDESLHFYCTDIEIISVREAGMKELSHGNYTSA